MPEGDATVYKLGEVTDHLESVKPGDVAMAKTMNMVGVGLRILKEGLIEFQLVCAHCDTINFDPAETMGACIACGAPLGRARPLEYDDGK